MDFKKMTMHDADGVFRSMASGTTPSPLTKKPNISSSEIYVAEREKYINRLNEEKNAFNAAIKTVRTRRAKLMEEARLQLIERQERKKKDTAAIKHIIFWCLIAAAMAINVIFAKNAMAEGSITKWATLWPSWIVISVTLLATAIAGHYFLKGKDASSIMFAEVAVILICSIVFACIYSTEGNVEENIFTGLLRCIIGYLVPVGVSGFIGLGICGFGGGINKWISKK